MSITYYPPGFPGPIDLGRLDPEAVAVYSFDWSAWLTRNSLAAIEESVWEISTGGAIGDGVTVVTRKGVNTIPAEPTLLSPRTACHIYATTAQVGDVLTVTNHIRAATLQDEASFSVLIEER